MKTLPDAYKIVQWHNNVAKYDTPPQRKEDSSDIRQEPRAKALILHQVLLCGHLDTEDISANTPKVAQRQISWQPFSTEEAYRATCKVNSTTLGDDEISCSAIYYRSAVDLTTALICDVKKAWENKKVVGIITTDLKAAFDGGLRNRLCYRLRSQGWPKHVVNWVSSFMSDRSAHICLDQSKTESLPILCGLPQGSPVSPILFLLYVESLLRLSRGCYGYADDAAIFAAGKTLEECNSKLQFQLDRALEWGIENGISFDTLKTELQYFDRKRKYSLPFA
ncbi:hypothetical protein EV44_g4149 [Erysiphe necator]|uniref:Reverse transcriptase domain-containing protein n=1 Tax=Uncinula necator TaxID=52586 RepID=A0A0B1PBM0_UNCNE|nr:hypothetical protein EV44_g4149 [Erysiphe necator]